MTIREEVIIVEGKAEKKQNTRREKVSYYLNRATIGLILLGLGIGLLYRIPKTIDEVLGWLPWTLLLLGILVFARRVLSPFKDQMTEDKSPMETEERLDKLEAPQMEPPAVERILPLTGKALLKMIWGMTLNLSHEDTQNDLGKDFDGQFETILTEYEKSGEGKKYLHRAFIQNLRLVIAGTLRDIAFIRENHVTYINYKTDKLTRRRKSLETVADPGSFSGPGLYSKIGSFVGAGSIGPFVLSATGLQAAIFAFGAIGFAGAVGITLLVRTYSYLTDDSWSEKLTDDLSDYWCNDFKVDMTNQLYYARRHIKRLIHQCYDVETAKKIMDQDKFLSLREDKEDEKTEILDIIREEILPPDRLKWSPYFVETIQTPTTDGGTKTSPKKGNGSSGDKGDAATDQPKTAPQKGGTKSRVEVKQVPVASIG